ncbi:hypothetical protein KSD_79300 [Ktedonobacter sp. SOSP1-85]|uniref:hypothetical protein n=1 Tax=Ktedonobacter sp. SOSP1-85 TaxID=2778367 RepID=UPI001916981B|nr:hypothetical protein [Ktedonobacter sp. SOSP1-85]GHO80159.1 hypothetical protein KSD_79300 [Ktedonobacter sp. SOSP1-85]
MEDIPGISTAMINAHESISRFGLGVMCLTGIIAVVGALIYRNKPMLPRTLVVAMVVLPLVNDALFASIGFLGGQIRHQEIRASSISVLMNHEQRVRSSSAHQVVRK